MNPYAPSRSSNAAVSPPSLRQPRTYLDAAAIGCGMSFIAPVCNAIYCELILCEPILSTFKSLVTGMIPTAFFCVICGIGIAALVPQRATQLLASHQFLIPAVVNSILFSMYFSLLGFGYVGGYVSIFGLDVTYYVLAPAMIAGVGVLLHVAVRPCRQSMRPALGG